MQLSDDCWQTLNSILSEWNIAEEEIKTAEQVANKVINPSIKELRYAGRRIVDALTKYNNNESMGEVESLLREALFDCQRARHDAIDAGTAKIAIDLSIMIKKLQYDAILPVFPEFPRLVKELQSVRKNIREARKNRQDRRAIYAVIASVDFPKLVDIYNDLMSNEHIMRSIARRRRIRDIIGVCGLIVGIIGVAIAILH